MKAEDGKGSWEQERKQENKVIDTMPFNHSVARARATVWSLPRTELDSNSFLFAWSYSHFPFPSFQPAVPSTPCPSMSLYFFPGRYLCPIPARDHPLTLTGTISNSLTLTCF